MENKKQGMIQMSPKKKKGLIELVEKKPVMVPPGKRASLIAFLPKNYKS